MVVVGDVFFLRCTLCNPPKNKFFVVALAAPLKFFLINSALTQYQQQRRDHVAAQARIFAAEHEFLDHDSFVGCDWLSHEYDLDALISSVEASARYRKVGVLTDNARMSVAAALVGNVHISRKYLRPLIEQWGAAG